MSLYLGHCQYSPVCFCTKYFYKKTLPLSKDLRINLRRLFISTSLSIASLENSIFFCIFIFKNLVNPWFPNQAKSLYSIYYSLITDFVIFIIIHYTKTKDSTCSMELSMQYAPYCTLPLSICTWFLTFPSLKYRVWWTWFFPCLNLIFLSASLRNSSLK